jgi:hypothetical protein
MIISPEFDSLTIVDSWNPAIITHEWVSKYLLPDEKLKVEYPTAGVGSLRQQQIDKR